MRIVRPVLEKQWDAVPGYDDMYWVSNYGEMISYRFWKQRGEQSRGKPYPVAFSISKDGHCFARLFNGGRKKVVSLGKLLLTLFVGPPTGNKKWACHRDGNPANNRITNLYWGTNSENQMDRIKHGTSNRGAANGCAKLTEDDAREIKRLISLGYKNRDIAPDYPQVDPSVISNIRTGRQWAHV